MLKTSLTSINRRKMYSWNRATMNIQMYEIYYKETG